MRQSFWDRVDGPLCWLVAGALIMILLLSANGYILREPEPAVGVFRSTGAPVPIRWQQGRAHCSYCGCEVCKENSSCSHCGRELGWLATSRHR
jgi:hypothetical protein